MGGKKKKQIKEPEVTLPNGDAALGKSVFEENCGACHALAVIQLIKNRVMIKTLLVQDSVVSLADKLEALVSQPVKPSRELVSNGQKSTCLFTCLTQESTFQVTRCLSLVLHQKMTEPTSLLTSSKTHETVIMVQSIFCNILLFHIQIYSFNKQSQLNILSFQLICIRINDALF